MQNNKFEAYIGFSIKSGNILFGSDKILESRKRLSIVIFDETTNVKIVNKLLTYSENMKCTLIKSKILLKDLTKRDNVKVVALSDKNLASAIIKNCNEIIDIIKEGK